MSWTLQSLGVIFLCFLTNVLTHPVFRPNLSLTVSNCQMFVFLFKQHFVNVQKVSYSEDTVITFIAVLYHHYKCITVAMIWYILRIWMHLTSACQVFIESIFCILFCQLNDDLDKSEWVFFHVFVSRSSCSERPPRKPDLRWIQSADVFKKIIYLSMVWQTTYFLLLIIWSGRVFVWRL